MRFVGSEDRLSSGGGWKLRYEADDGRALELELTVGGLTAEQLAAVHDYQPIIVAGHSDYVGVGGPGAFAVVSPTHQTLVIDLADGVHLVLASVGLTQEELLATAADLRVVDDETWRAAVRGVEPYRITATTAVEAPPPTTAAPFDASLRLTEAYVPRPDLDPTSPCLCNWRIDPLPTDRAAVAPPSDRIGIDGVVAVKFGQFSGFAEANQPVTTQAWIVIRRQMLTPSCPPVSPEQPTSVPPCGPVEGWSVNVVTDDPEHRALVGEDHGGLPTPTVR